MVLTFMMGVIMSNSSGHQYWSGGGPRLVQARCGFPELPYRASFFNDHQRNFAYYEEGGQFKVHCKNGLIGWNLKELKQTAEGVAGPEKDADDQGFKVDTHAWLECRNNQWNNTDLSCLTTPSLGDPDQWRLSANGSDQGPVDAKLLHPLIDGHASTCIELDDLLNKGTPTGTTIELGLEVVDKHSLHNRRVVRMVLMYKPPSTQGHKVQAAHVANRSRRSTNGPQPSIASTSEDAGLVEESTTVSNDNHQLGQESLEQTILEYNAGGADGRADTSSSAAADADGQDEPSSRFMDFVYLSEAGGNGGNGNSSKVNGMIQVLLMKHDQKNDEEEGADDQEQGRFSLKNFEVSLISGFLSQGTSTRRYSSWTIIVRWAYP